MSNSEDNEEFISSQFNMPEREVAKRLSVEERIMRAGLPAGLTPRQANAITQARIQHSLSDLAERNVDNVDRWLQEVASKSPSEAIRLFMELLEFRMPRMKAATVVASLSADLKGDGRDLKTLTIEELQQALEQG